MRKEGEQFDLTDFLSGNLARREEEGFKPKRLGLGVGADHEWIPTISTVFESALCFWRWGHKSGHDKTILSDISGYCKPGEMLLVLGRPGADCTTFLRVLSEMRKGFTEITGDIKYGGIDSKKFGETYRGEQAISITATPISQIKALTIPQFQLIYGDKGALVSRYGGVIVKGIIIASAFYNMPAIASGTGPLFFPLLFDSLIAQSELTDFDGWQYFTFILVLNFSNLCMNGFFRMFGSISPNLFIASQLSSCMLIALMVYSGYQIPYTQMHPWLMWIYWNHYLIEGFMVNQLYDLKLTCSESDLLSCHPPPGQTCQQYSKAFFAGGGTGYLTRDSLNSTDICNYCLYSKGEDYYNRIGLDFQTRWRGWGILLAFWVFNVMAFVFFVWLFRKR